MMELALPKLCPNCSGDIRSILFLIVIAGFVFSGKTLGQSTPQPTPPYGSNSVELLGGEYGFKLGNTVLYWYSAAGGNDFLHTGGTLHAIRALTYDNRSDFLPSNAGGLEVEFPGGIRRCPSDSGVTFLRTLLDRSGDTLRTRWRMSYSDSYIEYQYRIHISGRTLVIRVETTGGSSGTPMATKFLLDRCDHADGPTIVKIPYLSLFNLVSCNQSYVSAFFDWEVTNCSKYWPSDFHSEIVSESSVRFAPMVWYEQKTDGVRNPVKETIYITVSPDLEGALPNLPGPPAPMKDTSANRIVLSFHCPFPWLMYPPGGLWAYKYLDRIKHLGVNNLAVIIKEWQAGQFDKQYPVVLPANNYETNVCTGASWGGHGGNHALVVLRKKLIDTLHYDFALHQNYVDYCPDAPRGVKFGYADSDVALSPYSESGEPLLGIQTSCKGTIGARILKPSKVRSYAEYWSGEIAKTIGPNWSYLDVSSGGNPSGIYHATYGYLSKKGFVDYDARCDSAGMFLYTLHQYRGLAEVLRKEYGGPVQGEGSYQFLYAGYLDDFDGWAKTADPRIHDGNAPLFVDFALRKIHAKSSQHGVGHIGLFLGLPDGGWDLSSLDDSHSDSSRVHESVQEYIATELAYGHGGLVTKSGTVDHSIYQSYLEYNHVFPMQQAYMNASPTDIAYPDGETFLTASEYIQRHPNYWKAEDRDFMRRVRVTYSNGAVVYVNRSSQTWRVTLGRANGWFTRNVEGRTDPEAGYSAGTTFTLKAYSGWACYNPLLGQRGPK